jgi:hypothetical protein
LIGKELKVQRLTFEGNFCDIAMCQEQRYGKYCKNGACSQRKVWERLKMYEDREEQGKKKQTDKRNEK